MCPTIRTTALMLLPSTRAERMAARFSVVSFAFYPIACLLSMS
jgi:hypothetical protein